MTGAAAARDGQAEVGGACLQVLRDQLHFVFPVLDCDLYLVSDLQGAADTPEPPVPLLFLTFVTSRPPETSKAALKLLPQHACFGLKVSQNLPG